jgi:TnsA endonuclease N terminal
MSRFAQGKFVPKNPQKYIGLKTPTYRSSWEWQFMRFCDTNTAIQQWACEAIQIPYRNPLTGKNSIYVPDFFIQYVDAKNRTNVDLIEIKPQNQAVLESVGKSKVRQAQYIQNQAKWAAANAWCRQQGIKFRIITENELFHNGS